MVTYKMRGRGGTRGKVTGTDYGWHDGQEITAPEGEFAHLREDAYRIVEPEGDYDTRPMTPDVSDHHVGGGWYEVRGQKVRGEDEAQKLLAEDKDGS